MVSPGAPSKHGPWSLVHSTSPAAEDIMQQETIQGCNFLVLPVDKFQVLL